jgi:hypothetical protein
LKGYAYDEQNKKVVSILKIVFKHNGTAEDLVFHSKSIQSNAASFAHRAGDFELLEMIRRTRIQKK